MDEKKEEKKKEKKEEFIEIEGSNIYKLELVSEIPQKVEIQEPKVEEIKVIPEEIVESIIIVKEEPTVVDEPVLVKEEPIVEKQCSVILEEIIEKPIDEIIIKEEPVIQEKSQIDIMNESLVMIQE